MEELNGLGWTALCSPWAKPEDSSAGKAEFGRGVYQPKVDVKTTVGCGDAALAGMVWALGRVKGRRKL